MIATEFETWRKGYFAAFPETRGWFAKVESPAETLEVWRNVLSDTDFDAAVEVTRRLANGDLEGIAAYDREKTAAVIRREAKRITFAVRIPKGGLREATYRCATCLDAGSVTVWARRCVLESRRTRKAPVRRYVEATACPCNLGTSLATAITEGAYTWRATPRYDEAYYCRVDCGLPGQADVDRLLEFIGKIPDGPPRHKTFDEWNGGDVFRELPK